MQTLINSPFFLKKSFFLHTGLKNGPIIIVFISLSTWQKNFKTNEFFFEIFRVKES